MKKLWIGIGIGAFAILIALMIFFQLHIFYYNKGNEAYELGDYDQAIEQYEQALSCHVPDKKECDIRVNLALAMIAPIDIENLDDSQVSETIALLKEARDILTEEDCAHANDENGHDKDAQTLKDEIDQYIEMLENPQSQQDPNNPDDNDDQNQNNQSQNDPEKEDLDNLQEIMQQGNQEHSQGVQYQDAMDNFDYDSFFYDGNCW